MEHTPDWQKKYWSFLGFAPSLFSRSRDSAAEIHSAGFSFFLKMAQSRLAPRDVPFPVSPLFQLFAAILLAVAVVPELPLAAVLQRKDFRGVHPQAWSGDPGDQGPRFRCIRSEKIRLLAAILPCLDASGIRFAVVEAGPPETGRIALVVVDNDRGTLLMPRFCASMVKPAASMILPGPPLGYRRRLIGWAIHLAGSGDVPETIFQVIFSSQDHQLLILGIHKLFRFFRGDKGRPRA